MNFEPITPKLIDKLARLARLEFEDNEKEEILEDLSRMIGFVSKLSELDTTNVKPCLHMSRDVNVFREDVAGNMLTPEDATSNAPNAGAPYFIVPKVIQK